VEQPSNLAADILSDFGNPMTILFFLLVVFVSLGLGLTGLLLHRLKQNHTEKWVALGSPSLFINNSIMTNCRLFRFLYIDKKQESELPLKLIIMVIKIFHLLFFVTLIAFLGLVLGYL
jgi:hypothetical protein